MPGGGSIQQPPLVGRQIELAMLEQIIHSVHAGGRLVVLEGEAGIGKSRLIEATAQMGRAGGLLVISSRAEELEAHRPFGAIIDCIGQKRLGDRWDEWELGLDRAGERLFRVTEAVIECLEELCAGGSVIVAIEDLHWADVWARSACLRGSRPRSSSSQRPCWSACDRNPAARSWKDFLVCSHNGDQ